MTTAQAPLALANRHDAASSEIAEAPRPTPLEDPYVPPPGSPDILAPEDGPAGEPLPLDPQGD